MNKNKKILLTTSLLICCSFATGCSGSTDNQEVAQNITDNEIKEDGQTAKEFIMKFIDKLSVSTDEATVGERFYGSKNGELLVEASDMNDVLTNICLTINGNGDEGEFKEVIVELITQFCAENGFPTSLVLDTVNSLYIEVTSDEFLNSDTFKDEVENNEQVYTKTTIPEIADITVTLLKPATNLDNNIVIDLQVLL